MAIANRKIWVALGVVSTLAAAGCGGEAGAATAGGEAGEAGEGGEAGGKVDFSVALEKLLAGEGGEGGFGMQYENGKLILSPMTGEQIQQALPGNVFHRGEDIHLEFAADGTFSGVEHPWVKKDASVCEKAGDAAGYNVHEGQCMQRTEVKFPGGKWWVKDNLLCTEPVLPQAAESLSCVQVIVAIDRLALFSPEGAMLSKGIELRKGGNAKT